MTKKIFIVSGGTGGHIIPARCVAAELTKKGHEVNFFGDQKIYSYIKPEDGFSSKIIKASQLKKSPILLCKASLLIACGILQSLIWIMCKRPEFIVAFGGYGSFPMLTAATFMKRKIILHEQNAYLGKVNRLFASRAYKIALTFPQTFGLQNEWQEKIIITGNPVRPEIVALNKLEYEPTKIDLHDNSEPKESQPEQRQIRSNLTLEDEELDFNKSDFLFDDEDEDEFEDENQDLNQQSQDSAHNKNQKFSLIKSTDNFQKNFEKSASNKAFVESKAEKENFQNLNSYFTFEYIKTCLSRPHAKNQQNKMGYDVLLASDFLKNRLPSQQNKDETPHKSFEILVIGGSGGAKIFSDILPKAFFNLSDVIKSRLSIVQQCRLDLVESTANQYRRLNIKSEIDSFFNDMPQKIAKTDLIIARAGASSIFEFCAAKKPMILVPFADSADDHQAKNANYLGENGAAIVVIEKDFTISNLNKILYNLIANPSFLKRMSENASILGNLNATTNIAKLIDE